jgi:hypothetical protein
MLLYKYSGPRSYVILEYGSIFLTRPRAFNDPFDLNPYLTKFTDPVAMGANIDKNMKDIVVLSLAENCDSLLMWAHYALRHSGFLIGFEGPNILDRPTPLFKQFDAVSYCHHRASGKRFSELEDYEIYFRKSSEWSYEREWRLVETITSVGGSIEDQKPNWPFPLKLDAIKTVVVGHRGAWVLPKIVKLLSEERYRHVTLQFAIPHLEKYQLVLHDWPRQNWDANPPFDLEFVEPPPA